MAVETFVDVYLPLLQLEAKSWYPVFASFSVWPAKPGKLFFLSLVLKTLSFTYTANDKRQIQVKNFLK